MPVHTWQGLCKPSFKDDGYHCFSARSLDLSPIERVWDMVVRRLIRQGPQHLLLTLCGLAYKLRAGTFPRKISRGSLIPCHDA